MTTNRLMDTTIGTSQASLANASINSTSLQNYYVTRWVSPKLNVSSISAQTWTLNFAASESNNSANFPVSGNGNPIHVNVYVWRTSTGAKVGTILDGDTASEMNEPTGSSETSCIATFSGASVGSVTPNDDIIVYEMWARVTQAMSTSYTQTVFWDGTVVTESQSNVTDHASFIETPQSLFAQQIERALSESLSLSDGLTRLAEKSRPLPETLTIGESLSSLVTSPVMVKKGSFAKSTGGNGSTQEITIGFQAKAIIFWWTEQISEGYTDIRSNGIGFCDDGATATDSKTVFGIADDNITSSNTRRSADSDHCIKIVSPDGTVLQESYVSAISSTSYTLTHDTNTATATIIHYLAIGGSDITNTHTGTFATTTATGNQSVTSVGFQSDLLLMASIKDPTDGEPGSAGFYLGMASGPSNEACISITSEDGRNPSDTWYKQLTDRCITLLNPSTGAQAGEAEFTQFTSNGFNINWTTANDNASLVYFLAIKGGSPFVGNLLQPTSNGVQTYSTVSGKTPKGVMLFSANQAASSSIGSGARTN